MTIPFWHGHQIIQTPPLLNKMTFLQQKKPNDFILNESEMIWRTTYCITIQKSEWSSLSSLSYYYIIFKAGVGQTCGLNKDFFARSKVHVSGSWCTYASL